MPTIDITSPTLSLTARRRIAIRLTRWFRAHGGIAAHVLVRFHPSEPNEVFSGGVALSAVGDEDGPVRYALVCCCVAQDRDEAFRESLAYEIHQSLGCDSGTQLVYVRFDPIERTRVYFATGGSLVRADKDSGRLV